MSKLIKVGSRKDFPEGRITGIQVEGKEIAIAHTPGDNFYAFENQCTHAEAQLSAGDLEDNEAVCPLHGARFDVKTGAAITLPAVRPVQIYELKIQGDDLYVGL